MATDDTSPASLLLTLADRLDALPPSAVPPRDNLTMAHAAGVLRRLAPRVASDDPAVVAKAVGQIRSMRWSGPSEAAAIWGEAVEAVAPLAPAVAEVAPAGPAAEADPRAVIQRALREAYERGLRDGIAAERRRAVNIAQIWEDDGARAIEVLIADDAFAIGMNAPADLAERVERLKTERAGRAER